MLYVFLPMLLGMGFSYIWMMYLMGVMKGRHWPVVAVAADRAVSGDDEPSDEDASAHKLLAVADMATSVIVALVTWALKGLEVYVWYLAWQILLAHVEAAVISGSDGDIIGWSMGLGFTVCALCVRIAHHLDGVVDRLLKWSQPNYYRLTVYIEQQVKRLIAPLTAKLKQHNALPRWKDIVAQYGPLTSKEEEAINQHIRFAAFCLACTVAMALLAAVLASVGVVGVLNSLMRLTNPMAFVAALDAAIWSGTGVALAGVACGYVASRADRRKVLLIDQIKASRDAG